MGRFPVVVNGEEQHSTWAEGREVPLGWRGTGVAGTKEECRVGPRGRPRTAAGDHGPGPGSFGSPASRTVLRMRMIRASSTAPGTPVRP
ncbi:MbtH family protein [Streptomyces sp. NBC_01214]|uniref:MbtH family NRPS accessory protein n=1 Tax=Streptomyces sp. NBC_01214 TaxID=2903777 RepID=UPI0022584006|nr:MbtH family NRPS accessory protein [Streptomyces sp. NBC_01214]MCX4804795.1 MbtH family protein [Streptomyces sp. NBC_01214]